MTNMIMRKNNNPISYMIHRNHRKSIAGFTLIELLIVIGIIAVLIAVLLPVLSRVREQAKGTVCRSNLQQIGVAFNLYLTEHKGYGKPSLVTNPPGFNNTYAPSVDADGEPAVVYWPFSARGDQYFSLKNGWLTPYYKNPNLAVCPSLTADALQLLSTEPIAYGYSANGALGVNGTSAPNRVKVRNPAETMAWSDGIAVGLAGNLFRILAAGKPSGNKFPTFHGRHLKKGNVLWYDGHVSAEKPYVHTFGASGQYLNVVRQWNIGFLTPYSEMNTPQFTFFTHLNTPSTSSVDYYFWASKTARY